MCNHKHKFHLIYDSGKVYARKSCSLCDHVEYVPIPNNWLTDEYTIEGLFNYYRGLHA